LCWSHLKKFVTIPVLHLHDVVDRVDPSFLTPLDDLQGENWITTLSSQNERNVRQTQNEVLVLEANLFLTLLAHTFETNPLPNPLHQVHSSKRLKTSHLHKLITGSIPSQEPDQLPNQVEAEVSKSELEVVGKS
jgi:hypothetical protein